MGDQQTRRGAQRLWRATRADQPDFGPGTSWASTRDAAMDYTHTVGFGGPILYRADVTITGEEVLDLRPDPWAKLFALFGLQRSDYAEGEWDHEIIAALSNLYIAHGYRWCVFPDNWPEGCVTWRYLQGEPIPAIVDPQ